LIAQPASHEISDTAGPKVREPRLRWFEPVRRAYAWPSLIIAAQEALRLGVSEAEAVLHILRMPCANDRRHGSGCAKFAALPASNRRTRPSRVSTVKGLGRNSTFLENPQKPGRVPLRVRQECEIG
jgi:hypothetical protein